MNNLNAKAHFSPTRWSVVLQATDSHSSQANEALAQICRDYWHPLYFFVRWQGYNEADSADIVQGFFAKLLEKKYYKNASQEKGRFRTFLLTALKRYIINQYHSQNTQRRGGNYEHLSLDFELAEQHFVPSTETGALEEHFDRAWAEQILARAEESLRNEFAQKGKSKLFEALKGYMPGFNSQCSLEASATKLSVPLGTLKSEIHRTKKKFRLLLRQSVAETVKHESDVDEELRHLVSVLCYEPAEPPPSNSTIS